MSVLTVNTSKIYPDISDILESKKKYTDYLFTPSFQFSVILHTEDKDLDYRDGIILTNLYIVRDYINNIADYIEVQLLVPLGNYVYDIYNYLDNIEVTISINKQLKNKNKNEFITKERYKAVYLVDKNSNIPVIVNQSRNDLNQNLPITLTLQLLDRSVETLRIKTSQGSFDKRINSKNTDMSVKSFLKSIISEESNKILIENKPAIDFVSIEEPDQKDKLKSIVIPSYTRIVELPEYIQNKNIGIYNSGIGNYIQTFGLDYFTYKKVFFIYSLYNINKYKTSDYKIIFYNPVSSSMSITDITYEYTDKILKIIPYTITNINDKKETMAMSKGSGFRISNANSYMKKPIEMTEKGPIFRKDKLSTEVIYKNRKDNLNFAPNYSVTSNQLTLSSEILKNTGSYITIEVSNLDHDFIYPGAGCKIVYEDIENKVKEMYGVIHSAIISYNSPTINIPISYNSKSVSLISRVSLRVFCQTE